jgi:hypothetical protein
MIIGGITELLLLPVVVDPLLGDLCLDANHILNATGGEGTIQLWILMATKEQYVVCSLMGTFSSQDQLIKPSECGIYMMGGVHKLCTTRSGLGVYVLTCRLQRLLLQVWILPKQNCGI